MPTAFARDADLLRSLVHRIDPNDPGAFNNLGVLYHTKGLHPEAVDAFLRALAIDPGSASALAGLAGAHGDPRALYRPGEGVEVVRRDDPARHRGLYAWRQAHHHRQPCLLWRRCEGHEAESNVQHQRRLGQQRRHLLRPAQRLRDLIVIL